MALVADLDRLAEKFEAAGQDQAAWFQEAVAEIADVGDHGLVEKAVAHLLVEDDVDAFGEGEIRAVGGDEFDAFEVVGGGEGAGGGEDRGVVDGVDLGGAAAGGEGGEDAGAGAEIDDAVAGLDVALDRGVIEFHARFVGEHALLFVETGEVAAVEVAITLLGRLGAGEEAAGGGREAGAEASQSVERHEVPGRISTGSVTLRPAGAECNRKLGAVAGVGRISLACQRRPRWASRAAGGGGRGEV